MGGRGRSAVGAVVMAPGTSISVGRVLGNRHVELRRSRTSEESNVGGTRVPKIKNETFFCTCVIQHRNCHLNRPYSTHTAPMPVLTGSAHADILTKPSGAGFAEIRSELIEPGAATCVYQAKACSPTDQPVRKFEDGLGFNMTMKTFFILTYHIM